MSVTNLSEETFKFKYIAIEKDSEGCGFPVPLKFADYKDKKIVITGAPAAFSPTCSITHIPGYIEKLQQLLDKGVDDVLVVTVDNPFANNAWAKQLGIKDTSNIKFVTDPACKFTKSLGYELDGGDGTFSCGRYAVVVDKGKFIYSEQEENPASEVTKSGVDAVLAVL
ncbi:HBR053Wp [Eremothecium sinecaudum]|uniref:HBR053Wp n=1 Tax=Eremothecium sinecaudum TaxID=45286 RepID=A0A109UWT0_9SACH|nr:HBR053Wp [Eremothecium sinecaudum]AMD18954.1 HBR053Wp [Eremothecium sinecaudum]